MNDNPTPKTTSEKLDAIRTNPTLNPEPSALLHAQMIDVVSELRFAVQMAVNEGETHRQAFARNANAISHELQRIHAVLSTRPAEYAKSERDRQEHEAHVHRVFEIHRFIKAVGFFAPIVLGILLITLFIIVYKLS